MIHFKKNITFQRISLFLFLIFLLALFLRFYRLGDVSVGFHRDEAFLGYNAYSIAQTGHDMNGNFLPLHLQSFLYSPAGYSYLSIPFIKLFDLSAFSVRFASALFGSLTVIATYFLARRLFATSVIALFSATLLAISPWHINLSRTATENVIVVFFISLGVLLYLFWIKKNNWFLLILAFISFGITLLIYQAPRALLPLFIPLLVITMSNKLNRKKVLTIIVLFLITIIIPLAMVLSSSNLPLRIKTISVFSTAETQLVINEQIREDGVSKISPLLGRLFHNKLIGYSGEFLQNYFKHFSYDFLFSDQGLPIRYRIPNSGLLYIFELPLLLLGMWTLLKNSTREGIFLFFWVILAPVGSALTFDDVPNLQRTLLVFPALSIIEAAGFYLFFNSVKKYRILFWTTIIVAIMVIIYGFISYLHQYYVHQLVNRPWYRHEGYKELVQKVNTLLPNYKKAIITNRESAPTIFFLFYGKYNPAQFLQETKGTSMRDFDRINFGKYEFSLEECPLREFEEQNNETGEKHIASSGKEGILYVNYGICKTSKLWAKEFAEIKRGDGTVIFRVLEFKKP